MDPETGEMRGHERIDRRSLAMHQAIAAKLGENPALIGIARRNLDRWYATAGNSRGYLDGWREILARPLDEVLSAIQDDGERMTAMRQNSPFAGILSPRERWAIYARFAPAAAPEGDVARTVRRS